MKAPDFGEILFLFLLNNSLQLLLLLLNYSFRLSILFSASLTKNLDFTAFVKPLTGFIYLQISASFLKISIPNNLPLFLIAYIKKLSPTTPTYFDTYTQKNYLLFLIYLFCEQCTELSPFMQMELYRSSVTAPLLIISVHFYIERHNTDAVLISLIYFHVGKYAPLYTSSIFCATSGVRKYSTTFL